MSAHICRREFECCCIDAPHPDCPVHADGEWPPRCVECDQWLEASLEQGLSNLPHDA